MKQVAYWGPTNIRRPLRLQKIKDKLLDLVLVILLGALAGQVVLEILCQLARNLASFGVGEGLYPLWGRYRLHLCVRQSSTVFALLLSAKGNTAQTHAKQSRYRPGVAQRVPGRDFVTTAQRGGKVVRLTHRSHLPPGNSPGTHFYQRLSRPQGHSAIGRIMKIPITLSESNQLPSDL
jgi:hypothetical protein